MSHGHSISILAGAAALAGLILGGAQHASPASAMSRNSPNGIRRAIPSQSKSQNAQGEAVDLSDAELSAKTDKVIANQHADDAALDEYERIEIYIDRTPGANPRVIGEKTYRVVPTGTGTYKILLKDGASPASAAEYRRQLQQWAAALKLALDPNNPRERSAAAKYQKKRRDRADMVAVARDAFTVRWMGREALNGRVCNVLVLNPNPSFHPHSLLQDAMTHITAKAWIDEESQQMARAEARVTKDFSVGGGILGKLYRGGTFSIDQTEVAPGIWLPTRYQYDFSGRKFFFPFEEHQVIEASHYRRVGPPKEALAIVQEEIAKGATGYGDP
ncbi:MAG: hypothetical protein ACRD4S_13495 [Candidatus Acidiferrales bacterium]